MYKNLMVIMPNYFWQGKYVQDLKFFGEEGHFSNIANVQKQSAGGVL